MGNIQLNVAENQAEKKVLIADDDEAIVEITSMMLEMAGYKVINTLDGNLVLNLLLEYKPDLLLLDVLMGDVDGRDVCKVIKSREDTRHTPVLIFSASHEIKQSALDAGADGFMEKPFNMSEILGKIKELIVS